MQRMTLTALSGTDYPVAGRALHLLTLTPYGDPVQSWPYFGSQCEEYTFALKQVLVPVSTWGLEWLRGSTQMCRLLMKA
jgi:hypothetical protein